ncbi:MAG: hypothetical protein F4Z31_12475 [Gemmatimonadetes bacterium]|nr:hypothetical protein [Gemmatimonadota bacterium]MYE94518.1 hypothetical protein [Gemmatimonadota bacterium]MYJ10640.1 hypothetical protein [Gemmatimonadota bacterium]
MREDSDIYMRHMPDRPLSVTVSGSAVAATWKADSLQVSPVRIGSAEVTVERPGGESTVVVGFEVREAVETFGIVISVEQPAPLGYAETLTVAADWWSSALAGTDWPERPHCGQKNDELRIHASVADIDRNWGAYVRLHRVHGVQDPHPRNACGGDLVANTQFPFVMYDVDLMRHEIGHLLGLVVGHVVGYGSHELTYYWEGAQAVAEYRASGGDPELPGVPMDDYLPIVHWGIGLDCELMTPFTCGDHTVLDAPDAISLAAMMDLGYTVDMSKATPWRVTGAWADALRHQLAGERPPVIDTVVVESVPPGVGVRR